MRMKYFWVAVVLLLLTVYFYSVETFISSNSTSVIQLTEDLPITKITFVCARDPNDAWLNFLNPYLKLTSIEKNKKKIIKFKI
jgi:hypothetical protein